MHGRLDRIDQDETLVRVRRVVMGNVPVTRLYMEETCEVDSNTEQPKVARDTRRAPQGQSYIKASSAVCAPVLGGDSPNIRVRKLQTGVLIQDPKRGA